MPSTRGSEKAASVPRATAHARAFNGRRSAPRAPPRAPAPRASRPSLCTPACALSAGGLGLPPRPPRRGACLSSHRRAHRRQCFLLAPAAYRAPLRRVHGCSHPLLILGAVSDAPTAAGVVPLSRIGYGRRDAGTCCDTAAQPAGPPVNPRQAAAYVPTRPGCSVPRCFNPASRHAASPELCSPRRHPRVNNGTAAALSPSASRA